MTAQDDGSTATGPDRAKFWWKPRRWLNIWKRSKLAPNMLCLCHSEGRSLARRIPEMPVSEFWVGGQRDIRTDLKNALICTLSLKRFHGCCTRDAVTKESFDREPAPAWLRRHAKKPVPPLGTGAIMQPTPRGSGVWVGARKDTRARRHAANIRNTAGRAILLPPERKLRRANPSFALASRSLCTKDQRRKPLFPETPAGAYAPPTIMSPIAGLLAPAISRRAWPFVPAPAHTPLPRAVWAA